MIAFRTEQLGLVAAAVTVVLAFAATSAAQSAPTCALRFDQQTVGLPRTCLFQGAYNQVCGRPTNAVFAGDGRILALGLAFQDVKPVLYIAGTVRSATAAHLIRWKPDMQLATSPSVGRVTLEDGGKTIRVHLTAPVHVAGCTFTDYVGHYRRMIDAGPAGPGTAVASDL
jgi:hypothetical protein